MRLRVTGLDVAVSVAVGAQLSDNSLLSYAKPTVLSVEGCSQSGIGIQGNTISNGTVDCHRESNDTIITIRGMHFGPYDLLGLVRSEEQTYELQSLMRISYAILRMKKT